MAGAGDSASWTALKPGPRVREALRRAADLLFAPHAYDGTRRRPATPGYGAEAWRRITFLDAPVCDGCGAPFEFDRGPRARCAPCDAEPRAFERARAACLYDDASRGLILAFKHGDRTELSDLFARWVSRAGADLLADAEALVPVPLHRGRLLARRYNQAAEIARALARRTMVRHRPDALVRKRATDTQGGKSGSGRRRNVEGAFVVPAGRRAQVEGRRVLLIDDVMTTGATAEACAKALLKAGARAVDLAVVARVPSGRDLTI
jgi:ComF family protein